MAELIDINNIYFRCHYSGDCMSSLRGCKKCRDYVCDYEDIQNMPTTTEAEIRAKAIDEFAEKLIALFCYEPPVSNEWAMDNIYLGESIKEIITEVAEQLKEE